MGRTTGANNVRLRVKKWGWDRSRRLTLFTVFGISMGM
jgi:hypothetical protein